MILRLPPLSPMEADQVQMAGDAAALLGRLCGRIYSKDTIDYYARSGRLPFILVSGRRVFLGRHIFELAQRLMARDG